MSNYIGYRTEDNIKRKSNNLTENNYECSTNTNTKRWTTSGSAQSDHLRNKMAKEFTSEVREWTQEEINALNNKRSA